MSTRKVIFYTDKPNNKFSFGFEVIHAVYEHLKVQEFVALNANQTVGFESSVDWKSLAGQGFVAVVLYDVNDACVLGVSIEAGENAGLKVYELFGDELLELSNLTITGKKSVLNLRQEEFSF